MTAVMVLVIGDGEVCLFNAVLVLREGQDVATPTPKTGSENLLIPFT